MDGPTELLAGRLIDVCFRFRDPDSLPLLRLRPNRVLHPSLPASPFRTHTCMKTKMGLIRTGGRVNWAELAVKVVRLPEQWSYIFEHIQIQQKLVTGELSASEPCKIACIDNNRANKAIEVGQLLSAICASKSSVQWTP